MLNRIYFYKTTHKDGQSYYSYDVINNQLSIQGRAHCTADATGPSDIQSDGRKVRWTGVSTETSDAACTLCKNASFG